MHNVRVRLCVNLTCLRVNRARLYGNSIRLLDCLQWKHLADIRGHDEEALEEVVEETFENVEDEEQQDELAEHDDDDEGCWGECR